VILSYSNFSLWFYSYLTLPPGCSIENQHIATAASGKRQEGQQGSRAIKSSDGRIEAASSGSLIGGEFTIQQNPPYIKEREDYFNLLLARQQEQLASKPDIPIIITLPNGEQKQGLAFKTTPYDIAK
jgi:hypothetical protein